MGSLSRAAPWLPILPTSCWGLLPPWGLAVALRALQFSSAVP